jgi:carbon storage regulator CsrA
VLVLTRKVDEAVILGDHIKVKVIQIRGKQVRLGIEAPPGILIIREEENLYKPAKRSEPCLKEIHTLDLPNPKPPHTFIGYKHRR